MDAHRLLALRLAALADTDRQWLLSRLSPVEAGRVRALLDDMSGRGWLRDPALLRSVVATVAQAPAERHDVMTTLEHLDAPVWRLLAVRGLAPDQRKAVEARLAATHAPLQRQLADAMGEHALPEGWRQVLLPAMDVEA